MIKLFTLEEEIDEAREYFLDALTPLVFTASDGTELPYRLYVPPFYDSSKGYPLHIHLHGMGLRGNDNCLQLHKDSKQNQMLFAHQLQEPFLFVIPQCPEEYCWGAYMKKTIPWEPHDPVSIVDIPENPITRAVYELTLALTATYSIDRQRLYVSGASMGGCGCYELIYRYPDVYAGALIGCGYCDPAIASQFAMTPIYLIHGADDTVIPVDYSRRMVAELKKAGADFIYREYPGRGHNFTDAPDGDALLSEGMRWIYTKKNTISVR